MIPAVMKTGSEWALLRASARQFSRILVRKLRETPYRWADPRDTVRLGQVALESIKFRRKLLDHRPGPKKSEKEQLERMEKQVVAIISRAKKREIRAKNLTG
ncbi:MAG TPA: hypothetical protein VFE96_04405 [Candidatus Bathyarchaeia archaeon]|nr:hypothetical protein [Candidatus Bathyarchaeia archaeon]